MKNYKAIIISTLLFVSTGVFAEEHAAAALKHAEKAVTHGKAGHAPVLVEHAESALEHAKKSENVA
ncbi:MAG: metal-binding protein SmbP, partial [Methylococcaceae bacterium]|nr:metal-binding protein SmbP [Methylococcaceae bacterium]